MATDAQQVRALILMGIMPDDAEQIVAQAAARNHMIWTEAEAKAMARITELDIQNARTYWYYTDAVPDKWRRLLNASDAN